MRHHMPYWYDLLAIEVKWYACQTFLYWLDRINFTKDMRYHLFAEFQFVNRQDNPFCALLIFTRMQALTSWGLQVRAFYTYEQSVAPSMVFPLREAYEIK
jgi:hypothetical protein